MVQPPCLLPFSELLLTGLPELEPLLRCAGAGAGAQLL